MAQIFRIERTKNFTVMSNHHFKNKNLTLKAKGLLSLMLSLPDDWNYNMQGLATLSRDGIDSVRSAIKELEHHGYAERHRLRNGEGRITGEKSEDERVYPEISGKDTQAENGKTESILRESRNARRNSKIKRRNSSFDNRTVRNAEAESIASEEQRRFEEQKRIEEQERARAARRRNKRRSGPEL